jgi:hypothetical protein
MQQADLLSSLALKVNTENTDQSLENAWKVRHNFAFALISAISIQCSSLGMVHKVGQCQY